MFNQEGRSRGLFYRFLRAVRALDFCGCLGFGLVVFADEDSAQRCISELDGQEYEGRSLQCRYDEKTTASAEGAAAKVYVGNLPWSVQWQDLKDLAKV